jgi:hypothetical protein
MAGHDMSGHSEDGSGIPVVPMVIGGAALALAGGFVLRRHAA